MGIVKPILLGPVIRPSRESLLEVFFVLFYKTVEQENLALQQEQTT